MLDVICSALIASELDIVIRVAALSGIVSPRLVLSTIAGEGTVLNVGIAAVTCTNAVVGNTATVETVYQMYLAETDAWHALLAAFIPPAVGKGGVQFSFVSTGRLVATTPEVAETVVVSTARTTRPRSDKVTETTPCYADVVRTVAAVEVSINSVLKFAMVYPDVAATIQIEVVIAIHIIGAATLEGDVTDDDIAAV